MGVHRRRAREFICAAVDSNRKDIDRAEIAARAKALARKEDAELRAEARERAKRHKPGEAMDRILAAAAESADRVVAFPPRTEPHETPMLTEAERAVLEREASETPALKAVAGDAPTGIDAHDQAIRILLARGEL